MTNIIGYSAKLELNVVNKDGNTFPQHIFFNAPYKLSNFFRLSDGGIEYMLMSASAGVMANDNYAIAINLAENSKLVLTSQSSEKIHKMAVGYSATRSTTINLAASSYLQYAPLPTIPFADSDFQSTTIINMAETAQIVYLDIIAAGRVARNEQFAFRRYHSRLDINYNGKLIFRDNCLLEPSMQLTGFGMFENYSHFANLVIIGLNLSNETLYKIKELLQNDTDGAISQIAHGYLVRIFANTSEELLAINKHIIQIFQSDQSKILDN